jgi:hypothetical protein
MNESKYKITKDGKALIRKTEKALEALRETGYNFNDEDVEQAPVQVLMSINDDLQTEGIRKFTKDWYDSSFVYLPKFHWKNLLECGLIEQA